MTMVRLCYIVFACLFMFFYEIKINDWFSVNSLLYCYRFAFPIIIPLRRSPHLLRSMDDPEPA